MKTLVDIPQIESKSALLRLKRALESDFFQSYIISSSSHFTVPGLSINSIGGFTTDNASEYTVQDTRIYLQPILRTVSQSPEANFAKVLLKMSPPKEEKLERMKNKSLAETLSMNVCISIDHLRNKPGYSYLMFIIDDLNPEEEFDGRFGNYRSARRHYTTWQNEVMAQVKGIII